MEPIAITIDGISVSCPPGTSILEAARAAGIKIPSLCYHPELKPHGACRLCLVEETSNGRLFAACVTPVTPGMEIVTNSDRVKRHRRNIVSLMMAEHPESCLVCSKGNRCELRSIAAELGIGETKLYPMVNIHRFEQTNPFIIRDLGKCILCAKCIRADHELVVVGAIDYNMRGFDCRPATLHDLPLEQSSCTFCGTCVSICPTGALSPRIDDFVGTPEKEANTICGFCGVGCSLVMGSSGDRVVEVNPSEKTETVNGATLCVRGHFAHDFLHCDKRLEHPLIRTGEGWERISWNSALELAANRLLQMRKQYGPTSLAFVGSSKCTNEENYLFQKMARALLGTNNIDNAGYLSGRTAIRLLLEKLGWAHVRKPLSKLREAGAVLVLGADPTHSAPVAGYYVKRAVKDGLPLVEVNPGKTGLSSLAAYRLELSPGGDVAAMLAISKFLMEKGWIDRSFIQSHTQGFEEYSEDLNSLDLERLCATARIAKKDVMEICELLAGRRIAFVVGSGVLRQARSSQVLNCLLDLALITGSLLGGGGFYLLSRDCNEVGAWDMGSAPDFLPGHFSVTDGKRRKEIERYWKTRLSPDPGLNLVRMVEETEKGHLKGVYIMGENLLRYLPEKDRVIKAFANLEFVVVQDIIENETTKIAHLVLPGAAAAEKKGSFTNLEGRIQCFEPVIEPPGEAMADWKIMDSLMALLGQAQKYGSITKVREEIAQMVPGYSALAEEGLGGWVGHISAGRRPDLEEHLDEIPFSKIPETPPKREQGPGVMEIVFGSSRFHVGGGTRTGSSRRIARFCPEGFAEISFQDGEELGIQDGDRIRIKNDNGSVVKKAKLVKGQPKGLVFLPWAFDDNDAMCLVTLSQVDGRDPEGWNSCKANVQKI